MPFLCTRQIVIISGNVIVLDRTNSHHFRTVIALYRTNKPSSQAM